MKKKPATRNSPSKHLEVYDFDENDDVVQRSAEKIVNKFSHIITINNNNNNKPLNKSNNFSPITKYSFLGFFAKGSESKPNEFSNNILEVEDDDDTIKEGLSCINEIASSGSSNCGPATRTKSKLVTIDLDSDDDIESSSSTSSSKLAGDPTSSSKFVGNEGLGALEEQALEHCFSGCVIDNDVIVVWPDYFLYEDIYSAKCQITFSKSFIKVECFEVCGNERYFEIERTIDDIIKIESQWCGKFQTAAVKLLLKLGDEGAETSRGIAELRFAVHDPNWHKQQEAIQLLNTRYETNWVLVSDIDAGSKYGCLEKKIFFSNQYFPNTLHSVKEVIYPRGDPDAISLNMRDIELLQPETFVNDTIIDFYLKYLENKIKPEEKHRFQFFNCFFFRKLADLDRDRCVAGDGKVAFQRVRKWTRNVNLFEKDYIFIPVNFSLHWSLIVICRPGDAANCEDEDMQNLPKVPCILHFDSIKGSHRGLKNLFQSYLLEEWKERGNQPEDVSSKFLSIPFVPLELPQQGNSFDCGIFLLHYAELFIKHAPVHFNPFKKKEIPNFLSKNWFPPVEAYRKRAYIKDLIYKIAEDYSEKAPLASCDEDKNNSSEIFIVEERDADMELLEERCMSPMTESCHSNYPDSFFDQNNGNELLRGTPCREIIEYSKEQKFCRGSLLDEDCCSFGKMNLRDPSKKIMTPVEEVGETSEHSANTSSDREVNKDNLFSDLFGSNSSETNEILESPSTSGELATCIVEDSEEEGGVIEITDDNKSLFGLRKINRKSKLEGVSSDCIIVQENYSDPVIEVDKKLGSKRRSPRPLERIQRRLRSSSKQELHELILCE